MHSFDETRSRVILDADIAQLPDRSGVKPGLNYVAVVRYRLREVAQSLSILDCFLAPLGLLGGSVAPITRTPRRVAHRQPQRHQ